jgi:hypothetical protein
MAGDGGGAPWNEKQNSHVEGRDSGGNAANNDLQKCKVLVVAVKV